MSSSQFQLSSTATAIAIIVPTQHQSDINLLRQVHDKAYRKWEPHINVLYPFVDPSQLPGATAALREALKDQNSASPRVEINAVDVFRHRKNATVYLKSNEASESSLRCLRNVLTTALGCSEADGTHDGEYRPHLTVGQAALTGPSLQRLVEKVEKLKGVAWNVKSLSVLRRESTGEMKIVDEILLPNQQSEENIDSSTELPAVGGSWHPCFNFESGKGWLELSQPVKTISRPKELNITSYNLMVEPSAPSPTERAPYILKNISSVVSSGNELLHILCLQEVDEEMLNLIFSDPFIQKRYPFSTHKPSSVFYNRRNLVTLASEPFSSHVLHFEERHKSSLIVRFDGIVMVGNVHLTSSLTDKTVEIKQKQMCSLTKFLADVSDGSKTDTILAGDFNLTTSSHTMATALSREMITAETAGLVKDVISPAWNDAYLLNGDFTPEAFEECLEGEDGATFDRLNNPLAAMFESPIDNRPQRYDRILFRDTSNIEVQRFRRFGLPDVDGQCASDHYGVSASLKLGNKTSNSGSFSENLDILNLTFDLINAIDDKTNLEPFLAPFLPTDKDKVQREKALDLLQQKLVQDQRLSGLLLAPLGSYCMETYFKDSDVDVLAIGLVTPREFFDLAVQVLRTLNHPGSMGEDGFKAVHFVNSLVPIIELVMNDIKVDLQYCQAVELIHQYGNLKPTPLLRELVLDDDIIATLPPASLRPLNTFRDTAYILNTIPDLPAYRTAHRFLSLYLKRRGLYSAKFGYLGGIHLSLMLSRVVKLLAVSTKSSDVKGKSRTDVSLNKSSHSHTPATLVRSFFDYYAAFDWAKDVVADPEITAESPSRSLREPVYIKSIFVPTARLNVASSCTRLSAQTFASEFAIAREKIAKGKWDWCLRSKQDCANDFLAGFGAFALTTLDFWDTDILGSDRVREMVGALESRLTGLMVGLGKINGLEARLWPGRFREPAEESRNGEGTDVTEFRGYYLVGISAKDEINADEKKILTGKVINSVQMFERTSKQLKGFDQGNVWVEVGVVPRNKALSMKLVLDERDWGVSSSSLSVPKEQTGAEPEEASNKPVILSTTSSRAKQDVKLHSRKLRPIQDIISRIRWDPMLAIEDFIVGYEDRFLGVKEVQLGRWKSEQTDEEFIPMHRIVWLRKAGDGGEEVWNRQKRLDKICGSGVPQ